MDYPPIYLPARITMDFALAHQELIFLYGNDYFEKGCFGQSGHLGSQRPKIPNAYRIPTLLKFCSNPRYWSNNIEDWRLEINEAFDAIPKDGRPIIPLRRIGQGGSRCQELAPKVFEYITKRIKEIAYPNIVWQSEQ